MAPPDASFGSNGIASAIIGMGINSAVAIAVAIQSDGAIVVAGYAVVNGNIDFAAARFLSNGLPDSSFDVDGKVTTSIGTGQDKGNALSIQPDGKILVAGYASNGSNNDFALARYNADGSLDTSFDGDGKVTTPVGTLNDVANALSIQTDGKLLLAGSSERGASASDFAVVRYNTDGSLDGTFSADGKVTVEVSGTNDLGNAIALDSVGRAVVAGQADGVFGITRLLGDPFLRILSISRSSARIVSLQGLGVPGRLHSIQSSPDLSAGSFGLLTVRGA